MKVNIRRDIGRAVVANAEQLDGKTYSFNFGWWMDNSDPYPGEAAYIPDDKNYPRTAPTWIASGDLIEISNEKT